MRDQRGGARRAPDRAIAGIVNAPSSLAYRRTASTVAVTLPPTLGDALIFTERGLSHNIHFSVTVRF
jgi:hypothetical protein